MKRFITPIVHPASIMRKRWALEPAQISYLKRLAADPAPTLVDVSQPPPNTVENPTLDELREFCELLGADRPAVVFDVENAGPHLVCCGMLALDAAGNPDEGVCFRFRHAGGAPWWPWEQHLEVVRLLDDILRDEHLTKIGHFILQHDIPLLEFNGFEVRGPVLDTSVLCHSTHSELPKGLQFLATLFCGAPHWKSIKDDKDGGDDVDDE